MNQNSGALNLGMYLPQKEGWGRAAGGRLRQKLAAAIDGQRDVGLFRISLQGIKRLDVAFVSSALVSLVQQYLGTKSICLVTVTDSDVLENIAAAADRMEVPVTVWNGHVAQVFGLSPRFAAYDALTFALARSEVRATEYAAATGVSITSASSRFKHLWEKGFLARREGTAKSGGSEFVYRPIGQI